MWLTVITVSILSCGAEELIPTRCDDWCRATLRAGCENDLPHECVAQCRRPVPVDVVSLCFEQWDALRSCYQAADPAQFSCSTAGKSMPNLGLCEPEREAYERCPSSLPETARCQQICFLAAGALRARCQQYCQGRPSPCPMELANVYQCALLNCPDTSLFDCVEPNATVCASERDAVLNCQP